ncbi:MAG: outer membrane protein assembly factor BamA, partial [Candidatus Omnitrophica bacterium]|nr:outer membrane protein assembly factor BamA [Candidatus Omnitrophota bacterium]
LYLLGFFSDIKIDTEDYKEGIKLVIKVEERPIIEAISFTGMKRLNMADEKIKEQLKSKEKQYLDYPALAEDVRVLKKMYEKIGYSKVLIEHKVDIVKATNKAKIEFAVTEGRKVRIKNILVEGNTAFRDGRILKLMKNKRGWLFNAGILKEDVLKEDIERVKSFYRKNGYTDVAVDYKVEADPKKAYLLYITLTIKEGKKYLVGNITLQGNSEITQDDILKKLTEVVPGKVFSQEALQRDIMNIQGLYFDRGYIMAQVQENTSVNQYTGRVDITYNIAEKEITYVDKIKIRGNVKTRDVVIRRELRIHPQDRFDGEKLRRSKERLQNLGYFEEIGYDTENTDVPNKKDLIVDVKESKTGSFSFGGGYSTVDAFVGFIEVEQKNFDWKNFPYFTGAGQDMKVRSSFGTISSSSEVSFTNPWVFDYPVSFGFDAYKREHEREDDVGYGYDEKVTGGDIRLGKEISEYLRGDLMYRLDEINITDITDSASNDLKKEYGKNTISSIRPGLTFDSRDNVFDTRKGDLLTGFLDWAGGPLAGDKDYWKFFGRASHYFPLPKNSTLELRGRVGISDTYGDSEEIPIYERFFAGGAYTVRGYEERKIGPFDPSSKDPLGGESEIIGNIEYTYPLLDFIKVATFYDTGNVWAKSSDIGSGGFKSSFGLGFRIKTPIGPIMLDYGIPLNKASGEDNKDSGRFHFSASHGF